MGRACTRATACGKSVYFKQVCSGWVASPWSLTGDRQYDKTALIVYCPEQGRKPHSKSNATARQLYFPRLVDLNSWRRTQASHQTAQRSGKKDAAPFLHVRPQVSPDGLRVVMSL